MNQILTMREKRASRGMPLNALPIDGNDGTACPPRTPLTYDRMADDVDRMKRRLTAWSARRPSRMK